MQRDMLSELKQKRPFTRPEEELWLSLVRTADLLGRGISVLLKKQGLSTVQYNVLRILRGAGPAGLPCGEIGSRLVTRDPDVTRLLDRMRAQGWVTRQRVPEDRRVISARISLAGLKVLGALDKPVVEEHRRQLGFMNPREIKAFLKQLTRIRESLG